MAYMGNFVRSQEFLIQKPYDCEFVALQLDFGAKPFHMANVAGKTPSERCF